MRNRYYILLFAAALLVLLPFATTQPSSTVTFMMDFNIDGIDYDVAEVDGNGVGVYYPGDLENNYVCIGDTTSSAVFGIASGNGLNYIELSRPGNYTMKMSQDSTGNKFIIPVTTGGCSVIRNRMPAIEAGGFLVPYASFIARRADITYLVLNYSVDIIGDFSMRNGFILTMEKNNSQIIMGYR